MKLTKYGHACVFVEKSGSRLVIDPGELTELPADLSTIVAVVYTHKHGDHVNVDKLQSILERSPDLIVVTHPEVAELITDISCKKHIVEDSEALTIGPFNLSLRVVDHAIIWQTVPCKNMTVLIDEFYYYPGDSLQTIGNLVEVVGVPFSAPWLKISEAIDFTRSMKARFAMPTHNGLFNDKGHEINQNWLKTGLDDTDCGLLLLQNSESYTSAIDN